MVKGSRDPAGPHARRGTIGRQGGSAPRRLEDTPPRDGAARLRRARGSTPLPALPPPVGFLQAGPGHSRARSSRHEQGQSSRNPATWWTGRAHTPAAAHTSTAPAPAQARAVVSGRSAGQLVETRFHSASQTGCGFPPQPSPTQQEKRDPPATPDRRSPVFVPHPLVQARQSTSPSGCRRRGPSGVLHVAYLPCMAAARGAVQRTQPQVPSEVRACIGANRPTERRGGASPGPSWPTAVPTTRGSEYSFTLGMRRSAGRRRRDEAADRPLSPRARRMTEVGAAA